MNSLATWLTIHHSLWRLKNEGWYSELLYTLWVFFFFNVCNVTVLVFPLVVSPFLLLCSVSLISSLLYELLGELFLFEQLRGIDGGLVVYQALQEIVLGDGGLKELLGGHVHPHHLHAFGIAR